MIDLLKAEELAKILKCSVEFVYKHAHELGGIKIGRLVRFQLNKIQEVIGHDRKARNDLPLRLYEEGSEIQERRVSNEGRSQTSRSKSQDTNEEDKYQLHQIVQQSIKGCGDSEE